MDTLASPVVPEVVQQKLEAFEQLQSEFEACFQFKQDVHGLKRFSSFPVENTVRYLHALWVCECKDRLLSIYKNIQRYDGQRTLELLRGWQEGDTASVIEFLQQKLDMLPLGPVTRQLQEARKAGGDFGLASRLEHGRMVMLNRGMNLIQALDAIFALPEEQLLEQVRVACTIQYPHSLEQIQVQLDEMNSPLFSYIPHQVLAQKNMVVMNKLGIEVTSKPADQPGNRSWRVLEPTEPMKPYADHLIEGYQELTTPQHNNPKNKDFVDRPEYNGSEEV